MPAKVDMTPQTVPSKPMNGPPATAVDSTIMPFSKDMACAGGRLLHHHLDRLKGTGADLGGDGARHDDPCCLRPCCGSRHGLDFHRIVFQVVEQFLGAAIIQVPRPARPRIPRRAS